MLQLKKEHTLIIFDKSIYIALLGFGLWNIHVGEVFQRYQNGRTVVKLCQPDGEKMPKIERYSLQYTLSTFFVSFFKCTNYVALIQTNYSYAESKHKKPENVEIQKALKLMWLQLRITTGSTSFSLEIGTGY